MLLRREAAFDLAARLRRRRASIGEVYAFISGLYFRGKLAYLEAFASPPGRVSPGFVIVPGRGLLDPSTPVSIADLQAISQVPVDENNCAFVEPLLRDAAALRKRAGADCRFVLLGSIATQKYTAPLLDLLGDRLLFPTDFIGRGDMSRGGLMLRAAASGIELPYAPIQGATRHGERPPKLTPR